MICWWGLVSPLGPEDLRIVLEYTREWNTNARHCHAAQALLQAVLLIHPRKVHHMN